MVIINDAATVVKIYKDITDLELLLDRKNLELAKLLSKDMFYLGQNVFVDEINIYKGYVRLLPTNSLAFLGKTTASIDIRLSEFDTYITFGN